MRYDIQIKSVAGSQVFKNCTEEDVIMFMQTKAWEYGVSDEVTEMIFLYYLNEQYFRIKPDMLHAISNILITELDYRRSKSIH